MRTIGYGLKLRWNRFFGNFLVYAGRIGFAWSSKEKIPSEYADLLFQFTHIEFADFNE